ncbi:hypothetical protein MFLAVUS_011488 [Mucor flavus]|uniref:CAP-Gly domain-containing protein n=1 Tax=Mucor flavus TaxID=439312 RepID=A0ABP9Z791_9FUNG
MSAPNTIHIGSRIQIGKDRATVLYIGPVKGTKGEWLGIEWDDCNRGKHDGLHGETRYFSCRYPTSGSFIRYHAEKVITGGNFLKALMDRYTVEDEITTIKGEEYVKEKDVGELYFGGNKQIVVETVGFEKILRQLKQVNMLKVVGLAEQCIQSAGEPNEILQAKLAIEDLDLSRNLISNWDTISDITKQLPNLNILRLKPYSQSRLAPPPTHALSFSNLKILSLNQTLIPWKHIETLSYQLPQLEDLQLGGNELKELGVITGFRNLKCLNLEDNLISEWGQVEKLGSLPNLEVLYLNDNQLTRVEKPRTNEMFAKLRFLRIEFNKIDNWASLNALNNYPSLTKLRCKENPIFADMNIELQATHVVGRIKNVTTVNGNTVTNRERTDLERFYLVSCTKDGPTHEAISAIHPRYTELCKIHGEPNLQSKSADSQSSLKNRLITIHIRQREIGSEELLSTRYEKDLPTVISSVSKRFLPTMTIRNVKNMIQRLLKIPATKQQLFLLQTIQHDNGDLISMDMNDDLRDLKFYSINDGDEILVL